MPKTVFVNGSKPLGIKGSDFTAEMGNQIQIHRHDGIDADFHGVLDYAVAGGTPNAITVALNPTLTALVPGMPISFRAVFDNTGPLTIKVDSTEAKAGKKNGTVDLAPGEIRKDQIVTFKFDGVNHQIISRLAEPAGKVFYHAGTTPPAGALECNGAAVSRTAYAALFAELVTRPGFTAQTFSCTIASPAVFTRAGHGYTGGERLHLSTTGALPTGLTTTNDYFVERADDNTFYLHQSPDCKDARIATSGTQSGTHSYTQSLYGLGDGTTTFLLPDDRGLFLRGWDHGRGIDASRALGTQEPGAVESHYHTTIAKAGASGTGGTAEIPWGNNTGTRNDLGTSYYGGAETRPANRAYLTCITY